jgi:cellulose synthase/poly-beta-1,6-N-acetylglucosamine synthase-like glycosyltransferase
VGDRVKKPGQLNGKSANLNHVILRKIYPNVRRASQVPVKDIFMVMDCDHMVKPDIFNKMGPCMLDARMAVCLAPQCFHNLVYPDALDAANGDFMFGRLPYYFGAGVSFVTGSFRYSMLFRFSHIHERVEMCFDIF